MNTLDSWIDPDEISDLVSDLVSAPSKPKRPERADGNGLASDCPGNAALLLGTNPETPSHSGADQTKSEKAGTAIAEGEAASDSPTEKPEPVRTVSPAASDAPPSPELWAEQTPAKAAPLDPASGGSRLSHGPVIIRAKAGAVAGMPIYGQERPKPALQKEEKEEDPAPESGAEKPITPLPEEVKGPQTPVSAPVFSPSPFSPPPRKAPEIIFEKPSVEDSERQESSEIPPQPSESPDDLDDFEEVDALEGNEDLDFDTPQAYEISAFPTGRKSRGDANAPESQAAFQASEALESAKQRADMGGLLKRQRPKQPAPPFPIPPAAPEFAPENLEEARIPGVFDTPFEKPAPGGPLPFATGVDPEAKPRLEESFPSPFRLPEPAAIRPAAPPEPRTLRERLAAFAKSAEELANGTDLIVADFHSYPLLAPDDAPEKQAAQTETVNRVSNLLALIAERIETESEGAIQIFLKSGDWLCSLAAQSPAGGVSVTMRVPNPLSAAIITRLRSELEEALRGG